MTSAAYLDYNATAPLRPEARAAIELALAETGNASSVHRFGRQARARIEGAREQVAALIGARPEQVRFTSGGTEANNLALLGSGRRRLLVAATEHDSVLAAAEGASLVPVGRDGIVELAALAAMLAADGAPALVAVAFANNETGVIQPIAEIAALAHAQGALVHCDAVQAAGKIPVEWPALGVDYLSLSAHKLGGPQGAGALLLADGAPLEPRQRGGGQERGARAGTENVAGIAGFGAACEAARRGLSDFVRLAVLRDRFEAEVGSLAPGARVFGADAPRLPNTSSVTMPGVASETQVIALDLAGVAVSAGSACSSGKVKPSHVLRAMGASESEAGSMLRVSLGWRSEPADIDRLIEAWAALWRRTGRKAPVGASRADGDPGIILHAASLNP